MFRLRERGVERCTQSWDLWAAASVAGAACLPRARYEGRVLVMRDGSSTGLRHHRCALSSDGWSAPSTCSRRRRARRTTATRRAVAACVGRADAVVLPGDAQRGGGGRALVLRARRADRRARRRHGADRRRGADATAASCCSLERLRAVRELEPALWRMYRRGGREHARRAAPRARERAVLRARTRARLSSRRSAATWRRTRAARTR